MFCDCAVRGYKNSGLSNELYQTIKNITQCIILAAKAMVCAHVAKKISTLVQGENYKLGLLTLACVVWKSCQIRSAEGRAYKPAAHRQASH